MPSCVDKVTTGAFCLPWSKTAESGAIWPFLLSIVGFGRRLRSGYFSSKIFASTGLIKSALSHVSFEIGSGHSCIHPLLANLPSQVWKSGTKRTSRLLPDGADESVLEKLKSDLFLALGLNDLEDVSLFPSRR